LIAGFYNAKANIFITLNFITLKLIYNANKVLEPIATKNFIYIAILYPPHSIVDIFIHARNISKTLHRKIHMKTEKILNFKIQLNDSNQTMDEVIHTLPYKPNGF